MPRMFDILRGKVEEPAALPLEKPQEKPAVKPKYVDFPDMKKKDPDPVPVRPLAFPKNFFLPEIKKEKAREDQSIVSKKLISAVKQHGSDNQEKAREVYDSAVGSIRALLSRVRASEGIAVYMDKLYELMDNVFNQLVVGDSLLNNVYEENRNEYYLPHHIVNVLILSSVLGLNMGFNKSKLSHLGLASIFCDLGMDSMEELVRRPSAFTAEEREAVKAHVKKSMDIANSVGLLNDIVKDTISTHHERASGGGYPRGIGSDDINPYAKILGLVDTYEAMTHTRPHRDRINTHMAVRLLISSLKEDFDTDVIKIFINKMSVYPIGSIIKLDTGEMARVISVRPGSPLRPVVMVFRGPNGENVSERNIIDLSKQDFPAIKEESFNNGM